MKVLILGNSIVEHGPLPSIGWYGEWGMAATSKEKDFVHVLMDTLSKVRKNIEWDYQYYNIAYWERDFNYEFPQEQLSYKPDLLIIRLGENVIEEYGKNNDYKTALNLMINKFKTQNSKVLVTSNFWPNTFKDGVQKSVALENKYSFVDLSDLDKDKKNQSLGKFENSSVAIHPSDFGMRNIAIRILKQIK
ncbi:MAG: hypothetical protein KBF75_12720 [Saprospiraceae bacterium]|nr:hypothetical protein [Saprospiraceae bacterium]